MNKRLLCVHFLILASLILAACQPGNATPSPAADTGEGNVTVIRVGTGDSGDGLIPHQQIIQIYVDLYNKYKVAPPPADLSQFGGGNIEFDNGKAAMRLFGRWPQSGYLKNPDINLGVVAPPQDKTRANILFWSGFGITSASDNPEAACRFLINYAGEPGAQVWKDWALPAVKSVAIASGQTTDPLEGVQALDQLN